MCYVVQRACHVIQWDIDSSCDKLGIHDTEHANGNSEPLCWVKLSLSVLGNSFYLGFVARILTFLLMLGLKLPLTFSCYLNFIHFQIAY